MKDDLQLPEWVEWALGKLSFLLGLGGVAALVFGVAALAAGAQLESGPLYLLIGGPLAVVIAIGLYFRRTWAVSLALLLSLGGTILCGLAIASGRSSGVPDTRPIAWGVFFFICSLALLFLLIGIIAARKLAGCSQMVFEVKEIGPGLQCRMGEGVVAEIPRCLAGDLSWVQPGDQVKVIGPLHGVYRVLEFSRRRAEAARAADAQPR